MSKLIEVINSLNDENVSPEVKEQLLNETNALNKTNSDLYKRAKKAEGFEYNTDEKKWIKKEKPEPTKQAETNKSNERKDEVDYSKMAYLNSVDVRHPDDQKAVMDEAERLKLPLTDVLAMPHIKQKLKDANNQRKVEEGMPRGDGSSGSKTKSDVDYWVNRQKKDGSYETPEDPELAAKVIDARIKREERSSMFDPIR